MLRNIVYPIVTMYLNSPYNYSRSRCKYDVTRDGFLFGKRKEGKTSVWQVCEI